MGKRKRKYSKAGMTIGKPGKAKNGGILVFAYGSNLDPDQMAERCPSARVEGTAFLLRHRLVFCGYSAYWKGAVANAVPANSGSSVPGVLYRVNAWDLAYLDYCEGHPVVYRRIPCRVLTEDGRDIVAHVYLRGGKRGYPSVDYFRTVYKGYVTWGFHPNHLTRLVRVAL